MFNATLTAAILLAFLLPGSVFKGTSAAQCSYTPGTPIQLVGTPHLFIADDQGVLLVAVLHGGDVHSARCATEPDNPA